MGAVGHGVGRWARVERWRVSANRNLPRGQTRSTAGSSSSSDSVLSNNGMDGNLSSEAPGISSCRWNSSYLHMSTGGCPVTQLIAQCNGPDAASLAPLLPVKLLVWFIVRSTIVVRVSPRHVFSKMTMVGDVRLLTDLLHMLIVLLLAA